MAAMQLSHLEIVVADMARMEAFYRDVLGFEVTDRSATTGDGEMLFLSHDPGEHHQLVLRQAAMAAPGRDLVDHVAFRVESLAELRDVREAATATGAEPIETVSHGSTWSVYLRDPEHNRVEFFVDTPWQVAQPCRFEVDLSLSDAELAAWTADHLSTSGLL